MARWCNPEEIGFSLKIQAADDIDAAAVFSAMRDLVGPVDLHALHLTAEADVDGLMCELLRVSWPALSLVRDLRVHDEDAFDTMRALVKRMNDSADSPFFMPNLENVYFDYDVHFHQRYPSGRTFRCLLKKSLQVRAARGLHELIVHIEGDRGLRRRDVQMIRESGWAKELQCDFADVELTDESDIDGGDE